MRDGVGPPAFVPALTSSSCSLRKHRQAARFLKPSRSYVRVWLGLNFILEPGSCSRCSGRHRGDPAAATPPGSRAEGSRGAREPVERAAAAARTRTARPGGRRDTGRNAGHCNPGAAVEAPPLLRRPPLSMEPAAARSHSLLAPAAAASAAAGGRARLVARATRRQLEAAAQTGQRRRGCAPPPSPAFKLGPRARARLRAPLRLRARAVAGGAGVGWGAGGVASASRGRGSRPKSRALPALRRPRASAPAALEGVEARFVQGQGREASRALPALRFSGPIEFPLGTDPSTVSCSQGSRSHYMTTEASRLALLVKARKGKFIEFSLLSPSFSLSPISSIS